MYFYHLAYFKSLLLFINIGCIDRSSWLTGNFSLQNTRQYLLFVEFVCITYLQFTKNCFAWNSLFRKLSSVYSKSIIKEIIQIICCYKLLSLEYLVFADLNVRINKTILFCLWCGFQLCLHNLSSHELLKVLLAEMTSKHSKTNQYRQHYYSTNIKVAVKPNNSIVFWMKTFYTNYNRWLPVTV